MANDWGISVGQYTCRGKLSTSMSGSAYWELCCKAGEMPLITFVSLMACLLPAACARESHDVMHALSISIFFWQENGLGMACSSNKGKQQPHAKSLII